MIVAVGVVAELVSECAGMAEEAPEVAAVIAAGAGLAVQAEASTEDRTATTVTLTFLPMRGVTVVSCWSDPLVL
ncbi:MAG TPA: hypothetical protein PLX68_11955 [Dermatophilaceae bacterium]|nr:hypothetical protein [Dermatophilaceae bacterium]